MLVMLKRDFFGPNGVMYRKSRDSTPTVLPNSLKGKLPKDAKIVDERHEEDDAPVIHKKESPVLFFSGETNQAETLAAADPERGAAEAVARASEGAADTELEKRRANFRAQLAAEKAQKPSK